MEIVGIDLREENIDLVIKYQLTHIVNLFELQNCRIAELQNLFKIWEN